MKHSEFVVKHREAADATLTIPLRLTYREAFLVSVNTPTDTEALRAFHKQLGAALVAYRANPSPPKEPS